MIPQRFFVTSGKAFSPISELNALDLALKNAGISQCNLVPVTSILPHGCVETEFIDIPIVTGIGHRRNFLVISTADIVIAIGGRWGTLNEISFSMIFEKPLILIRGTGGCVDEIVNGNLMQDIESSYYIADSAEDAVEKAFNYF